MKATAFLALAVVLVAASAAPWAAAEFVDPNAQTEGTSASLTGAKLGMGGSHGLTAATALPDQKDAPNAGFTLISPHGASDDGVIDENMWSWEYDGYNMDVVGKTVMVNVKDPSWPVLWNIFDTASDTQYAPIVIDLVNITWLDGIAQGLTDKDGNELGYVDFLDAANNSAIGVLTYMAANSSQGIFGVLGSELTSADQLVGGINEPVNDDTAIPPDLNNLPDADALKAEYAGGSSDTGITSETSSGTDSGSAAASSTPSTPSGPPSAGTALQAGLVLLASAAAGLLLVA